MQKWDEDFADFANLGFAKICECGAKDFLLPATKDNVGFL